MKIQVLAGSSQYLSPETKAVYLPFRLLVPNLFQYVLGWNNPKFYTKNKDISLRFKLMAEKKKIVYAIKLSQTM